MKKNAGKISDIGNTMSIHVPAELLECIELIAEKVHEEWAKKRIEEGWCLGPCRNDEKKLHPSLIPFAELSEEEKEYDRQTVKATLSYLIENGYEIVKE